MKLQFKRTINGSWEDYQLYVSSIQLSVDTSWLLVNGYWWDANGTYFPPGSIAQTKESWAAQNAWQQKTVQEGCFD